jgi:23S rRNA (adenine2503-C2)-methyltransferase
MTHQKNIRTLSVAELTSLFEKMGEKAYRARQVFQWIWQKGAVGFSEMSNIPKGLRENLELQFEFGALKVAEIQESADGTLKFAFQTHDGKVIESVLIPTEDRLTICVSSQVGCSLTCAFCATGKLKRMRNLLACEIYDQVWQVQAEAHKRFQRPLTNIVYMGMGEPLLNLKEVLESIEHITSAEGLNMSASRITVSTAGIAKMIVALADAAPKVNLALSLHAPDDLTRTEIMPINESNNLKELEKALLYYYRTTYLPFTFEYVLLAGTNDSEEQAHKLAILCKRHPVKVNIIEYNPVEDVHFKRPSEGQMERFKNMLQKLGITATIRRSRGRDIDAACGQLANKNKVSDR